MHEYWLWISFTVILLFALNIVIYPIRKQKRVAISFGILFITFVCIAYWYWGGFSAWDLYLHQQEQHQKVQAVLKSIKGPQELIQKLKKQLDNKPTSARGWYLLGRLYASQAQWQDAHNAFVRAHNLKPNNEIITINYIENLWQLNHQQYNDNIRDQLRSLLHKDPNQLDALSMLAMDAYLRQEYQQAIDYWQRILKLIPPESEEAKSIRKAIAKAQGRS